MERNGNTGTYGKRLRSILCLFLLIWAVLTARLGYWQIICHEELSSAAVSQYQVVTEGLDTRGAILDRNLEPLTGGTAQYYYFLKSERLDSQAVQLLAAVEARRITSPQNTSGYEVYRTAYFDETVSRRLQAEYGAYCFSGQTRYQDSQPACHLIGYLNQSELRGVSGLEQLYEDVLEPDGRSLVLWADGGGNLLLDTAPKQTGGQTLSQNRLVTALDCSLQKYCEERLSDRNAEGTVMVSDAESGEVLAWVSSPSFNPNAVETYLGEGGSHLVNKCIQGLYAPGSVFKIVVAAAALESDSVDPRAIYECTGVTEVGGVTLGCQAGPKGGHGDVDMYQAMAVSCNCYFAELGEQLGAAAILDMAENLGFGNRVFCCFAEEETGVLPAEEACGPWDISNLSIGQGRTLVTPAQIQQMMGAVASGGIYHPLKVVLEPELAGESGGSDRSGAKRVLSDYTAEQLNVMLQMVMQEGTGSGLKWADGTAGKTGTAEAVHDGEPVNNCWFSGYCRTENGCFVITVLIEQGISGSASALPVFHEICGYLMARSMQSH